MNIGITFDLKSDALAPDAPDDAHEEFDSPHTIDAIAAALRGLGHTVALLGDGRAFVEKVLAEAPDFVFNFAEGHGASRSREARVPALLDLLGIPYSGSEPFAMCATLDKACARTLVRAAGLHVAAAYALEPDEPIEAALRQNLPYPLVVKPAWEGSSKGIRARCLVQTPAELPAVVEALRRDHRQTILLEEYIAGDELTVGLIGNGTPDILGVMRIVPNEKAAHFIYSLEIKRDYRRLVTYECPAPLPEETLRIVEAAARTAFRVLGCRDVARVDFRVRAGVPYFLEVNPLPGLNPDDSDLVIMSRLLGWSYERLVGAIVGAAFERCGLS